MAPEIDFWQVHMKIFGKNGGKKPKVKANISFLFIFKKLIMGAIGTALEILLFLLKV